MKIILDLCGGTGSWSKPYKEAGYEVINVTLPEHDVRYFKPPDNVYGILAAPPCTMFSRARTRAKTPRDFAAGMETVYACLKIVWECRIGGSLKWWALENPMGFLRQFLGRPAFTFKPSDFWDNSNKTTDLWGYFNEPKRFTLKASVPVDRHGQSEGYSKVRDPGKRAITPPGFARAFFEANQ